MFLHVANGSNPAEMDLTPGDTRETVAFAESSGVISAVLYQVPNQPIVFDPIEGTVL